MEAQTEAQTEALEWGRRGGRQQADSRCFQSSQHGSVGTVFGTVFVGEGCCGQGMAGSLGTT